MDNNNDYINIHIFTQTIINKNIISDQNYT